jgi:predicted AAA+ superfamily ATPase
MRPHFHFWRESNGVEVDCLIERGNELILIRAKSTQTLTIFPTGNLKKVTAMMGNHKVETYIIYGGEHSFTNQGIQLLSWKSLDELMQIV